MSKYYKKSQKKIGLIALCIGAGLMLAVLVPFWGWILAAGAGLIAIGWFLLQNSNGRK